MAYSQNQISVRENVMFNREYFFNTFRNNQAVLKKYSGFLQCTMALVNTLCDKENEHLDELLSAEKVCQYNLFLL